MKGYIGILMGVKHYESEFIPIGKIYPTGRKDGNRLGRRKRKLEHSGFVYFNHPNPSKNYMLVHPSKINDLIGFTK